MPDEQEQWEPVLGFAGEDVEAELEALPAATSDLSQGGFDDIDLTIVGFEIVPGGEPRERDDGTSYTTRDTLVVHNRVDDPDVAESVPYIRDFLSLPKKGKSGKRGRPSLGSKYGIWLSAWEELGVSGDPQLAKEFQMGSPLELMGIRYHRVRMTVDGYNGPVSGNGASAVYGFDNDYRKSVGLANASLKSEKKPVATAPRVAPRAAAPIGRARAPQGKADDSADPEGD